MWWPDEWVCECAWCKLIEIFQNLVWQLMNAKWILALQSCNHLSDENNIKFFKTTKLTLLFWLLCIENIKLFVVNSKLIWDNPIQKFTYHISLYFSQCFFVTNRQCFWFIIFHKVKNTKYKIWKQSLVLFYIFSVLSPAFTRVAHTKVLERFFRHRFISWHRSKLSKAKSNSSFSFLYKFEMCFRIDFSSLKIHLTWSDR